MNDIVNECVIEWIKGDSTATITAYSGSKLKNRIKKLADSSQVIIKAENKDGSILAHVPVEWIRINPPRSYSDEQREKLSERARKNLHSNATNEPIDKEQ